MYELLKPVLRVHGGMSQWASFVVAGFVSGVVASLVLCPAEDIRIRSVADPGESSGQATEEPASQPASQPVRRFVLVTCAKE